MPDLCETCSNLPQVICPRLLQVCPIFIPSLERNFKKVCPHRHLVASRDAPQAQVTCCLSLSRLLLLCCPVDIPVKLEESFDYFCDMIIMILLPAWHPINILKTNMSTLPAIAAAAWPTTVANCCSFVAAENVRKIIALISLFFQPIQFVNFNTSQLIFSTLTPTNWFSQL